VGTAAATVAGHEDTGGDEGLDVAQGGIERAVRQLRIPRGRNLRIGAVEQRVDDRALTFADANTGNDTLARGRLL